MAIEDEIINISDIDVGTEILNNDKIIIETNNGTKLLAFKDFVIGEDNITFKDKLIQGRDETGAVTSTVFTTVTGFDILTKDSSAGHITTYQDVSGSIGLTQFNFNAVSHLATLSGMTERHEGEIANLKSQLSQINTTFTSSSALSTTKLTLSATNFKATMHGRSQNMRYIGFSKWDLNPTDYNPSVTASINPFKITYPTDGSFNAGWVQFIGLLDGRSPSTSRFEASIYRARPGSSQGDKIFTTNWRQSSGSGGSAIQTFNHLEWIEPGDTITISSGEKRMYGAGSYFSGVKLG
tara:strand:+ start:41 stop:925 length:885 start_codon:yes stop_codon:yes gene_type:complete